MTLQATIRSVEVTEDGVKGGLGVRALETLPSGTVFASLPLSLLFSIEHVFVDPWAEEHLERLSDTEAVALYVARMREHGAKAEYNELWTDWVALLPDSYPTMPLFYSSAQQEMLQTSMVRSFTARRLQRAQQTYSSLPAAVKSTVAFEQFLWGLSTLWSRTHGVRLRDRKGKWQKAGAFVPFADLLNMPSSGSLVDGQWVAEVANADCQTNNVSTHFECHTTKDVRAGEELLVPYGSAAVMNQGGYGNGQLLLDYGLTLERNPFDIVQIDLPPLRRAGDYESPSGQSSSLSDSTARLTKDLLKVVTNRDSNNEPQAFQLRVLPAEADQLPATELLTSLPRGLTSYLRLHAVDDALLERMGGAHVALDALLGRLRQDVPFGPEHELASIALLAATASWHITARPSSRTNNCWRH
jgi:hypothetical protein